MHKEFEEFMQARREQEQAMTGRKQDNKHQLWEIKNNMRIKAEKVAANLEVF
jgi:hypothetical protein